MVQLEGPGGVLAMLDAHRRADQLADCRVFSGQSVGLSLKARDRIRAARFGLRSTNGRWWRGRISLPLRSSDAPSLAPREPRAGRGDHRVWVERPAIGRRPESATWPSAAGQARAILSRWTSPWRRARAAACVVSAATLRAVDNQGSCQPLRAPKRHSKRLTQRQPETVIGVRNFEVDPIGRTKSRVA